MATPLLIEKIREAARRSFRGESLTKIANDMGIQYRTLMRWKNTDYWKEGESQEAEAFGNLAYQAIAETSEKIQYRNDLIRSREILRQTLDNQIALSGNFALIANEATALLLDQQSPIESCSTIAKSGIAATAQASAQVSRSAMELLNRIYAIDKILDYFDKQQLGV